MYEKIMEIIAFNNGMMTDEAKQKNNSLKILEKIWEIERVVQGLYLHKDYIVDSFYLGQYRSPKSIFSHSTESYHHRLSDEYPRYVSFVQGSKTILPHRQFSTWDSIRSDTWYKIFRSTITQLKN